MGTFLSSPQGDILTESRHDQMIAVCKPFCTNDHAAFTVIFSLGSLAKPALPFLEESIQNADPSLRRGFENLIRSLTPKPAPQPVPQNEFHIGRISYPTPSSVSH